ncbi:MAG: hypothetical protein GY774_12755 [Planctomycetes bacterium]|nr:hypothetical protein [Planctomycetota bacterium]
MLETELKKNTEALNRLATALEGNNVHAVGGSVSDSVSGSGGGDVPGNEPETVVAESVVAETFTVEQLNGGLQSIAMGEGGMPAAMAVLQGIDVTGIGELDPSRYPELAAAIRAAEGAI